MKKMKDDRKQMPKKGPFLKKEYHENTRRAQVKITSFFSKHEKNRCSKKQDDKLQMF